MLFKELTKSFHAIFTSAYIKLFSILLNDDFADIEKPDGICLATFVVDEFSGLFLHPSVFSIKHSRSESMKNGASSDFRF